jgi:hypothetical protein
MDMISTKIKKIGFEDVQYAIHHSAHFLIINTMPVNMQDCLIQNTVHIQNEEKIINDMISDYESKTKSIIIYGLNSLDLTCEKKCKQLHSLGLPDVYWYVGGLFEWTMLQDIYGQDEFPTTKKVLDLLKFKSQRIIS